MHFRLMVVNIDTVILQKHMDTWGGKVFKVVN